jgi:hypothetical protein
MLQLLVHTYNQLCKEIFHIKFLTISFLRCWREGLIHTWSKGMGMSVFSVAPGLLESSTAAGVVI